jgi:predicted  nucleic acid-binding Zn-ribbon protein
LSSSGSRQGTKSGAVARISARSFWRRAQCTCMDNKVESISEDDAGTRPKQGNKPALAETYLVVQASVEPSCPALVEELAMPGLDREGVDLREHALTVDQQLDKVEMAIVVRVLPRRPVVLCPTNTTTSR